MDTLKLKFKGRLRLEDLSESDFSIHFQNFEKLLIHFQSKKNIKLDFMEVEFIYPSFLTLLLALIKKIQVAGCKIEVLVVTNSPVHEYLIFCHFNQFVKIDEFKNEKTINSDVLPFKIFTKGSISPYKLSDDLVEFIKIKHHLNSVVQALIL
jgi:hypothetical protein